MQSLPQLDDINAHARGTDCQPLSTENASKPNKLLVVLEQASDLLAWSTAQFED